MANYGNFFRAARQAKAEATKKTKKLQGLRLARGLPIKLLLSVSIGLCSAIWVLMNVERIESFISSVDIKFLGTALAEQAATTAKSISQAASKGEKASSDESSKSKSSSSPAKSWTPEQLTVFNKLEERKKDLDLKEQELGKLEEELQKQRIELEDRLKDLEKLRTKIAERLAEKVGVDQVRVDKLVEIYSNMKPQTAAKVFEELDEDLAIEIFGKMKKKNMAEILNLLKSDKAQRLSEKFAGYKSP